LVSLTGYSEGDDGLCRVAQPEPSSPSATPPADPGAKISVCHGVGGMFAASGTIIMSNQPPR